MQYQIILLLGVFVLALTACAREGSQLGTEIHSITVDEKAASVGEPAKIVSTAKGLIYAFSFDEKGKRVTCQTPIKLDSNQKIIPQGQWIMHCAQPSIQLIEQLPPKRELNFSSDALFDFGKSDVRDMKAQGRQSVEQLAKLLRNEYSQQPQLVLTGYTDRIGPPEANQALALARAESVAEILRRSGINRGSITALGKGSTNPLIDCPGVNVTPELIRCLQPNRRVTIDVIGN